MKCHGRSDTLNTYLGNEQNPPSSRRSFQQTRKWKFRKETSFEWLAPTMVERFVLIKAHVPRRQRWSSQVSSHCGRDWGSLRKWCDQEDGGMKVTTLRPDHPHDCFPTGHCVWDQIGHVSYSSQLLHKEGLESEFCR
jgi:hypothetical protein